MSEKIRAGKVLFIKLGKGGEWEKKCLEKDNVLILDFRESNHLSCMNGDWNNIQEQYITYFVARNNATPKTI